MLPELEFFWQELNSARRQLGTLGGGNHFAQANRQQVLEKFHGIFQQITEAGNYQKRIDTHYNYAALEKHFGKS